MAQPCVPASTPVTWQSVAVAVKVVETGRATP
jgi:hypothetical protein